MDIRHLFTPAVPVLLVGPPGVGKTSVVSQMFGYSEIMLASTMVEEDISGLPYRDGTYDMRTTPAMFRRLHEADANGKSTVLFLDELDKARRSVADTLLTLIASRGNGQDVLPINTCIVAAANPPQFGGGDGISDAMISRFAVIEYEPRPSLWVEWARSVYKSDKCKRVIDYVGTGEIPLIDVTGEGFSRRISSPRTLAKALDVIDAGLDEDTCELLISGLLTPNVASLVSNYAFKSSDAVNACVDIKQRSAKKQRQPLVL